MGMAARDGNATMRRVSWVTIRAMQPWADLVMKHRYLIGAIALLAVGTWAPAMAAADLHAEIDRAATAVEAQVIAWRRDIHRHPELSNREFRTAELAASHLRSLGLEVTTGIAGTGVLGVLRGGKPGPVVALRADMDGLPGG